MDINKKLLEIYKSHHLPSLSKFIKYVRLELDSVKYPITNNKIKEWYDNQKINLSNPRTTGIPEQSQIQSGSMNKQSKNKETKNNVNSLCYLLGIIQWNTSK